MYKYETTDLNHYKYRLYDIETGETLQLLDKVAICFSYEPDNEIGIKGTVLKHGDPLVVKKYYETIRRKFMNASLNEMAEELRYIEGEFNVYELNNVIEITGYIGRFYENLLEQVEE